MKGREKTSVTIFFTLPGTLDTVTVLIVVSQGITLKVKMPGLMMQALGLLQMVQFGTS